MLFPKKKSPGLSQEEIEYDNFSMVFLLLQISGKTTPMMVHGERLRSNVALNQVLDKNHKDKSSRLFPSQAAFNWMRSNDC